MMPASVTPHKCNTRETLERASYLLRSGKVDDAVKACQEMVRYFSADPDALYICAMIAHQSGNPGLAIRWINQAIRMDPHRPDFNLL
jgi:tetratricopeptide (TPR) repeat protein